MSESELREKLSVHRRKIPSVSVNGSEYSEYEYEMIPMPPV